MNRYPQASSIVARYLDVNRHNPQDHPNDDWNNSMVILMRGLSGSGKSTFANELMYHFSTQEILCEVVSADKHFWHRRGKVFVREELGYAHDRCFERFERSINTNHITIVDNTNIKPNELLRYISRAERNRLKCVIVEFECNSVEMARDLAFRLINPPPDEVIEGRYEQYERLELRSILKPVFGGPRAEIIYQNPYESSMRAV